MTTDTTPVSIGVLAAASAVFVLSSPARAVVGPELISQPKAAAPTLLVADGQGRPARAYPLVGWDRIPPSASAAWARFESWAGGNWHVLWDLDTGVPNRILGSGVPAPGSMEDPALAERYAFDLLAQNIDLLAPGARVEDFTVVTNHLGDGMRTIGMLQFYNGMRVLGGQVNFRFKADRLFVIGSEAAPHVSVPTVHDSLELDEVAKAAAAWIDIEAETAWSTGIEGPYILPVVSRGSARYHIVYQATVEARSPRGRWHVYMDARNGQPVAREQQLRFGQGTLTYNVPLRYPAGDREALPARDTSVTVAGVAAVSDLDGILSWPQAGPVDVTTSVIGSLVQVVTDGGEVAAETLALPDGGVLEWNHSDSETWDAQLTAYIHTRVAKDFVRAIDPSLAFLDDQLRVNVNIDDQCNAFYDGTTTNFFRASAFCENTGRLADVVYHEFGHAMHDNAALDGVGIFAFDFGEGLSDYLSAAITNDPGMGRGFFFDVEALRHLDPPDDEAHWPEDISEIHITGLIFGGAMWDLRKSLIAKYGPEAGASLANRLFYAAVQRASSIPNTYVEILAADDDDGDLDNGTPNECEINYSFGTLHGLRASDLAFVPLDAQPASVDGYEIRVPVPASASRCPGQALASAVVEWGPRDPTRTPAEPEVLDNVVELTDMGGEFSGFIPRQPDGTVVRYRLRLTQVDGGVAVFPTNLADTAYEFYVGDLIELYCHDFESDPFQQDWQAFVLSGDQTAAAWEWGTPMGLSNDPSAAYAGNGIIGTDLGLGDEDGVYTNLRTIAAQLPLIDTSQYSDVRLQYRRWLTVEDALFDQADIVASNRTVWSNLETAAGSTHHLDTGWVFHDVPLNTAIFNQSVQVSFLLASDEGLEFGGWNIDDLCIVANPSAICGDSQVAPAEQCDNGADNSDIEANACRSNCRLAYCGDGVVDRDEECDDRNNVDTDECTSACVVPESAKGGCGCETGKPPEGAGPLMLLFALFGSCLLRRRRTQN